MIKFERVINDIMNDNVKDIGIPRGDEAGNIKTQHFINENSIIPFLGRLILNT